MPGRAAYGASKAGIVGLTRVLGVEWAGRGVRVNAAPPRPGADADGRAQAIAEGVVVEQEVIDRTPAGRFAEPEDVARAVVLLCSPDAGFVTAQTLVVDGGYSMYGAAHPATRLPGHPAAMPDLHGRSYSRAELSRGASAAWSRLAGVRLVTLGDGVERGVRRARVPDGHRLRVRRGRRPRVRHRPLRARRPARSPGRRRPASPARGSTSPRASASSATFGGGLLTTCGLDHALFMAEDTAEQYHYPPKPTETFGLHGRVSNRPARLAGYGERWDGDECVLYAEGEVLQAVGLRRAAASAPPDRGAGRRVASPDPATRS